MANKHMAQPPSTQGNANWSNFLPIRLAKIQKNVNTSYWWGERKSIFSYVTGKKQRIDADFLESNMENKGLKIQIYLQPTSKNLSHGSKQKYSNAGIYKLVQKYL